MDPILVLPIKALFVRDSSFSLEERERSVMPIADARAVLNNRDILLHAVVVLLCPCPLPLLPYLEGKERVCLSVTEFCTVASLSLYGGRADVCVCSLRLLCKLPVRASWILFFSLETIDMFLRCVPAAGTNVHCRLVTQPKKNVSAVSTPVQVCCVGLWNWIYPEMAAQQQQSANEGF